MQEYDGPSVLHSDNGTEFKNHYFDDISRMCGIKLVYGAPYQPQVQGADERFNNTIKTLLLKLMHQ